jgi:uracil phosphoribosyltransferase
MIIHNLSEQNSVLNQFLAQIRDVNIQKDSMRFRRNIERIGEIMAYEISKTLEFRAIEIATPLGTKNSFDLQEKLVLCSILRAGLPMHIGFLNYLDQAENGFVSAYRDHTQSDDSFEIKVDYAAIPTLNDKILVLIDPMLATGQSIVAVLQKLLLTSKPKAIHVAVTIAAPEGIRYLEQNLPDNCHLWVASLDEKLNQKNYIIPGLGDAGDLAYGNKL